MNAKVINLADQCRPATVFDYPYIAGHLRQAIRELKGEPAIKPSMVAELAVQNIARGKRGIACAVGELEPFAAEMLRRRWGCGSRSKARFR